MDQLNSKLNLKIHSSFDKIVLTLWLDVEFVELVFFWSSTFYGQFERGNLLMHHRIRPNSP